MLIAVASRNCTKRGLRCAYMDDSLAAGNSSPSSTIGEFAWPSEVEVGTRNWQHTKIFPFPHLQLTTPPNPDNLSTEECHLLFHICTLSANLELNSSARFTTWAHKMPEYAPFPYVDCKLGCDRDLTQTNPSFVRLATRHYYAMQSLVALSATHLASVCKSAALDQLAFVHRGNAFRSLSEAVGSLAQENSDAVLAASAQLCWQSPGW